jgi:hypothetical protein
MKVYGRAEILLDTGWRVVLSSTLRPLYLQGTTELLFYRVSEYGSSPQNAPADAGALCVKAVVIGDTAVETPCM